MPFEVRLLFAGLWTVADREGRLEDRPKKLKMEIFPADDVDMDTALQMLHDAGLIVRYVVDDKGYIQVTEFVKHQNPHVREAESTIPAPDKPGANTIPATPLTSSLNPSSLISDSSSLETDEETIYLGVTITAVKKTLCVRNLTPKAQAEWLKHIHLAYQNGFSTEDVTACLDHLQITKGYAIRPEYVTDQLPAFVRKKRYKPERLPSPEEKLTEAANAPPMFKPPPRTSEAVT